MSLHQLRQYRVLVFRQDSQQDVLSTIDISNGQIGTSKRGNGRVVSLPSGKNDVLHALVESGGLPGLDARDTIWVIRSKQTPKPVNQVAYNGIPSRGAPIPAYPQQRRMMPPGMPMQTMPGGQPMMPQPGVQPLVPPPVSPPPQPGVVPPAGAVPTPGAILPGHSGPDSGPAASHPGYGAIQQTGYWMMQTPKQFAENLTGIPMPPREGPSLLKQGHSAIAQGAHMAVGVVAGSGAIAASAVAPYGFDPNRVLPAGCQSCQTGSPMPMGAPYGSAPIPYGSPPMMMPTQPVQPLAPPQPSPLSPMGQPLVGGSYQPWQAPGAWNCLPGMTPSRLCSLGRTIRIPLRVEDCSTVNISEYDVQLNDGDIIFIQSRDDEVFYTGGLLGGGQYNLPRDHDIDILEAISIAQGRNAGGGGQEFGRSSLNNDVTISASQAVILRKLPNGSQVPILVDLYRARKYRSERMLVQRGDYIVLQYTKLEAIGAFIERHILESALFGVAAAQLDASR